MRMFCIQARIVTTTKDGYTDVHEVPSFLLDADYLGITDKHDAGIFATAMIGEIRVSGGLEEGEIHVGVEEVTR